MNKINWCKKQSKGIKLVEPNDNLSEEYFNNAEESLRVLRSIKESKSNMWLATTKYYIEYFAVYAVLMKIGIKCEIHECTIELTRLLEEENILKKGISNNLKEDKGLRIDNQYYLKNREVKINFEELSNFLLSIKQTLEILDKNKIEFIKEKLNNL